MTPLDPSTPRHASTRASTPSQGTVRHALARFLGKARPVLAVAALAVVALSGCTGMPTLGDAASGGRNAGGASQGGLAQVNGQDGIGVAGASNGTADANGLDAHVALPQAQGDASIPVARLPDAMPQMGANVNGLPVQPDAVVPPQDTMPGWLVQFQPGTADTVMKTDAEDSGGVFVFAFKSLPIAYILMPDVQVKGLTTSQHVLHVEREQPLHFDDAMSRKAIRSTQVTDLPLPLHDTSGRVIDGTGVGVAVVDTGIDALHTDLPYGTTVGKNLKVESQTYTDLPDTDTTSGHGTHVSGIIAGQGITDPSTKGVAPGATLYGLGIGEASTTVWAAQAFDWILQNYNSVSPRIRIVSNSWSTSGSYDPASSTTLFVNAMVAHGMTVVFSAGNGGGDGTTATTSPECQIPTAGVLCVAGYDDLGNGTTNGLVGTYSSRGATSAPSTWPDISAPGTAILSTRPPVGSETGVGLATYVELTGTSQAAPHVTGAIALMLQKKPTLTPAAIESTLKSTAHKYTDLGAYASSGSHYAKGYGLLDADAAVLAL